jgi:ribosomal-protein-alanine N-acetyltransferase
VSGADASADDGHVPRLLTTRLVMRDWTNGDRVPFAELNADAEVMRHFPSTLTAQQSDEMVDRIRSAWVQHGYGLWAVERADTSQFIGFVGLSTPSWASAPIVEVGWRLAQRHWGYGFASEAATAALGFGFSRLDLPADEIVSFTTVGNDRSRRVMERIGLTHRPERDFDHPLLGHWHGCRHVLYALDRAGWALRESG